jgi:peptidoglycan/LPS O-acetylase OafA/YrhL
VDRPTDKRLPYMPGIDALRAIAVLAVFAYHVGAGWMPGGFLGVDVFFVISGYLITALLLGEYRRTGHLDVLRFWLRRARRLLPAVAVMIAVTLFLAAIFIPEDIHDLRGDAVASLLYVNNWHLIFSDQSYFEQFARPSLFRHLWSLSVEEQFYLLWPLLFAAGMTLFGRRKLLYGVLAGALASTLLMVILFNPNADPLRVFYGTDTRAVGLLGGVALALVWHPNELRAGTAGRYAGWVLDVIGIFALAMVVRDFVRVQDFDPSLYRGGFLLLAVWTTLLVGVLAHPAARLGRVLGTAPMVWLGLRSYSFYLWHWPILALTRPDIDVRMNHTVLALLQLGLTLLLADLSYRYVEQPFRQRSGLPTAPEWLRTGRVALAAGVLATVLFVGWSGLFAQDGGGRVQAEAAQTKAAGRDQPPGKPPSVLAVGDSVMVGAADGLQRRLGDRAVVDADIGRQATDFPPIIDNYRRVGVLPDEVVVQMGNNGPVYSTNIDALRQSLAGVDDVYIVNVRVPRSWESEVNDELSQAIQGWPQATLLDWYDIAGSDPNLTYDGIHLTPDGDKAYSDLISNAVEGRASG